LEKADFRYRQKPSPISFLFTYGLCIACSYLLFRFSAFISGAIGDLLALLRLPKPGLLAELPVGKFLSIPFFYVGIRTLFWNMMSYYEIEPTRIRLMTGYLTRREQFIPLSDVYEVSFTQNLIEAPFRIGTLVLKTRSGQLSLRGVYRIAQVVEDLRKRISYF